MNQRYGRIIALEHDEIGTITVQKLQRLLDKDTKRERKSAMAEISRLMPKVDASRVVGDWIYELNSVSLGADVAGNLLVFAFYESKHIVPPQQETPDGTQSS